jgi:putative transcriptional regulator
MNEALFQKLTTSLQQAREIRGGTLRPGRRTTLTKGHPAAVRARLGKSQEEFAAMIGVPLGTLRNWEQGRREPTGPAKALLIAAAKYPEEVADALAGPARSLKLAACQAPKAASPRRSSSSHGRAHTRRPRGVAAG